MIGLLLAAAASPVATTNEIYVLAAVPGQASYVYQTVRVDAPLTLAADASGVLHLGAALQVTQVTAGSGMAVTTTPGIPANIYVNTDAAAYQTAPPSAPGPCIVPGPPAVPLGSAAFAVDPAGAWFYVCVPDAAQDGGLVWARAALATAW